MQNTNGTALITGATSGIGLELAKLFVKDGYNLIIVARSQDELDRTAMELTLLNSANIQIIPIVKDLFEPAAAFELYEQVKQSGLVVNVLVNNAGQGKYGFFVETDIHHDINDIQLNVISLVVLTKLFLRDMVMRNEGKILQLGSVVSKNPAPMHAVYGGTKAFVHSFTEAVINEVKETNVTLTVLMPGGTDTDFFRKGDFENAKMVVEGKLADPATVAKDGYEALMAGKDKVVSGLKNKVQAAVSNVMTDQANAENVRKQMEPVDPKKK